MLLRFGQFLRLISPTDPRPTGLRILRYARGVVKLNVFIAVIKNFNQPSFRRHSGGTAYLEAGHKHRGCVPSCGAGWRPAATPKSLLQRKLPTATGSGVSRAWTRLDAFR